TVDAERAIAVEHDHLRIGLRDLGADTERQPDAHAPERARVQPMTGHVGRDRLSPVVQDLLAVDHEDRVALEEVADLLAEPERMDRRVLRAHLLVHLGGLLRVQHLELRDPARIPAPVDLAARFAGELLEHGMPVASTKAWNAAAASDHHTPLPPRISGRSAFARSAIASLTAPGSPSVRGAGAHGLGYAIVDSSRDSPRTSPGTSR